MSPAASKPNGSEVDHYRCPYCPSDGFTSENQREVRVHIEEATDAAHKGREGFSPLTDVEAVDAAGNRIDTVPGDDLKREPDEVTDIARPEGDLSKTEQQIVVAKMMHLDYSAEEIVEFLHQHDEDVSKKHVQQTLRNYFGTTEAARGERSYSDFNERQQRAIDAVARWRLDEYDTQREAAEDIGENPGYLSRYNTDYECVVNQRMEMLNAESDDAAGEETETIRQENNTGSYVGAKQGIDATMQHITERPALDDASASATETEESATDTEATPSLEGMSTVAVARGQVDLLRRLVQADELDAETAFNEVERIVTTIEAA